MRTWVNLALTLTGVYWIIDLLRSVKRASSSPSNSSSSSSSSFQSGDFQHDLDNDEGNMKREWAKLDKVVREATNNRCHLISGFKNTVDDTTFTVTKESVLSQNENSIRDAIRNLKSPLYSVETRSCDIGRSETVTFAMYEVDTLVIIRKAIPKLPRSGKMSVLLLGFYGSLMSLVFCVLYWAFTIE
jgi:hypothetical protein